MNFSVAIKQLREELHLQQTELAVLLNVDVSTVSRWERGKTMPSRVAMKLLLIIARERGASETCIANLEEASNPSKDAVEPQNDLRYTNIDMINQLVNDSANGVIVVSLEDKRILYVNNKAAEMSGRTIEDASTMNCYEYLLYQDTCCEFCDKYSAANGDYQKYEYTSPVTGRHYVISNRLVTWQGIAAQIKYLTDITELHELQMEVKEKQEALKCATQLAGMQVFKYDIKADSATLISQQTGINSLPLKIPNFRENVLTGDKILPAYRESYAGMLQDMIDGKEQSDIEIMVDVPDGKLHWTHFQMNLIDRDEQGNPSMAICTVRIVDREKSMENRIRFEHQKILEEQQSLQTFATSNLSQNKVMEIRMLKQYGPSSSCIGTKYDDDYENAVQCIISKEDQEEFRRIHNRTFLIQQFQEGVLEFEVEYRIKRPDGYISWLRNMLYLYQDPVNGDVYLYDYCFDINEEKLFEGVLDAAMKYQYNHIGIVFIGTGQLTKVVFTEENKKHYTELLSYEAEVKDICQHSVIEADREQYLADTSLSSMAAHLSNTRVFTFHYRIRTEEGIVRNQRGRISWFDQKNQVCLISTMDVGEVQE